MVLNVEWNLKPYALNEDQIKQIAHDKGGIYRLSNKKVGIFYVGQSDNLKSRLLEHLSDKEENNCIKKKLEFQAYFRYALLESEKDRLCAESFMYQNYKKEKECECNDKEPSETPCEINLL